MSRSKYCLLVEDDPEDQEFFIDTLHAVSSNAGCYAVSNGKEALAVLMEEGLMPDFIFTDLDMPVMSGLEFITKLRSMEQYRTIPVIIYTGSVSEENIEKASALNVLAIHPKARVSALKDMLRKYFASASEQSVL
jgi:CheY-like chemotaxis protein